MKKQKQHRIAKTIKSKNTLWLFGDSFAECRDNKELPQGSLRYQTLIAEHFNLEKSDHGIGGSGLEYSFSTIDKYKNHFKENDIVIFCLTDIYRVWFVESEPSWGGIGMYPPPHQEFVSRFLSEYFVPQIKCFQIKSFLHYFDNFTKHLKIKPIILPCFIDTVRDNEIGVDYKGHCCIAKGNLHSVSRQEYRKERHFLKMLHSGKEFRPNHLSGPNHEILAKKIINYIDKGDEIDLNTGFVKWLY